MLKMALIVALTLIPGAAWAWTPTTAILADVEPYRCNSGEPGGANGRAWYAGSPILMDSLLLYTESLHPYVVAGVVVWRMPGTRFLGFLSPPFGQGPSQVTIPLTGIPLLAGEWIETWWWCGGGAPEVRGHPLNVFAVLYYRAP